MPAELQQAAPGAIQAANLPSVKAEAIPLLEGCRFP
jgi:hypothetical protein